MKIYCIDENCTAGLTIVVSLQVPSDSRTEVRRADAKSPMINDQSYDVVVRVMLGSRNDLHSRIKSKIFMERCDWIAEDLL
jgi:hypothetical protein